MNGNKTIPIHNVIALVLNIGPIIVTCVLSQVMTEGRWRTERRWQ